MDLTFRSQFPILLDGATHMKSDLTFPALAAIVFAGLCTPSPAQTETVEPTQVVELSVSGMT